MPRLVRIAVLAAILVCLVPGISAQTQNNSCQPIHLLLQAKLDFSGPPPLMGWFGPVRGFLNNTETMDGMLYYLPPAEDTKGTGQAAHEYGDRAVFDFGTKGVFITVADGAVFHMLPGVSPHMIYPPDLGFGNYSATVKVAPDAAYTKGRFASATGNLTISGLFLVNVPPPAFQNIGVWNAEITGRLCNVKPQQ